MQSKSTTPIKPSPSISILPIALLVALLFVTIMTFGSDALGGGSQICLLAASAVCAGIGIFYCKVSWEQIEEAISGNIKGVGSALLVLLLIGALSGSWMISGVVPTFIYYGLQILHPSFFLISTCLICAIVSVMTGSSWTTIATIGIALMGIGEAQGFTTGWVAGAIISGAYFGDKVSPLSDTTVLASSVNKTPLFTHIRYMMITTTPSFLITLLIFLIVGLSHQTSDLAQVQLYSTVLNESFNISLWTLIVPLLTVVMIAKKVPSLITLFLSATMGIICAIILQPNLLHAVSDMEIQDTTSLFKGSYMTIYGSTQIETGNESINSLVATRGMSGMLNTIWLILCAMCFGGAMTATGMLDSITKVFTHFMKRRLSMVSSTVFAGIFLNLCTADQYISIILTGKMFGKTYESNGYESKLLSRTTEDAVTVTSVLIPWNTCGMTQATILNVSTLTYLPYCFFNILSPLMTILIAAIGYKIRKIKKTTAKENNSSTTLIHS